MRGPLPLVCLALLLTLSPRASVGREEPPAPGPVPTPDKNFSYVHAHVDWVESTLAQAQDALESQEWVRAVRLLQSLVDQVESRESPMDGAPYVVPVQGAAVFEGAWIHARLQLAGLEPLALKAYAHEYGGVAQQLVERGLERGRPELLEEAARRFLPLPEGRRAALRLIDVFLEQGEGDRALGWIEQLEDLDAASSLSDSELAPWIQARVQRHARALAGPAALRARIAARLLTADRRDASSLAEAGDEVEALLPATSPPPTDWLTTGGDRTRNARVGALGAKFELRWVLPPLTDGGLADSADPTVDQVDRPSAWLPPRAACWGEHVFINDGERLHVLEAVTGRYAVPPRSSAFPEGRRGGVGEDTSVDRRERFGLLEGHALTILPLRGETWARALLGGTATDSAALLIAAVPDGRPFPAEEDAAEIAVRDDHLQTFLWDGQQLTALWSAGGPSTRPAGPGPTVPQDARLYGAALHYAGKVWIGAVRPSAATKDRWESWLYGLDPATGTVLTRAHLGTGTPVRRSRVDEVIPTSPSAARGRVVIGTALGILASVDASSGRPHWIYRYDRAVETDRGNRRVATSADETARPSTFLNEPPSLVGQRVVLLPTDGEQFSVLFDRPRGAQRMIRAYDGRLTHRTWSFQNFAAEHLAGVRPPGPSGAPQLFFIGQTQGREPPGPLAVARDLFTLADSWMQPAATGFGARPYGRALLTESELFVSLPEGIAIYAQDTGRLLGMLDPSAIAPEDRAYAPPRPYGNLIPVPGRGVLAVSATTVSFWAR